MSESRLAKACYCFGIALLLVLFCSCLSFDIADWPSSFVYPHNRTTENWCGSIGAFLAYYLLYYVGPGVFAIIISGLVFMFGRLFNRGFDQMPLRLTGLILLTAAASSSFYFFWPDRASAFSFPNGSGGVLGVAAAEFLRSHFASLGTFIILIAAWTVGILLLADVFIILVFRGAAYFLGKLLGAVAPAFTAAANKTQGLKNIWRRLSLKNRKKMVINKKEERKAGDVISPSAGSRPAAPRQKEAQKAKTALAPQPRSDSEVPDSYEGYSLPPVDLLAEPEHTFAAVQERVVKEKAAVLEKLLGEFNVNASVVAADTGPVVTMFELQLAAGVKVSQISALANDMARALGVGAVRVVAPLPGKHTIGIEVPNSEKEKVRIRSLMEQDSDRTAKMQVPLFLGKDSSGEALTADLAQMPHLLIAGTTGSGKSVCINSIITGIMLTRRPDEVKLILIDPKMVEMTGFSTIPHLMSPIVTETQQAAKILEWATVKMDERYSLLAEARVKNIAEYNRLTGQQLNERFNPQDADEEAKIPKKLPYIVIVIDELADLMMVAAKDIEAYIVRLAQKSRAVGIHIVLATQRPQATVVTGLIKSNMPTRIGFRVAARMDSRIILDQNGAETLLGEGDMLFLKPGTSDLVRAQGTYVEESEVRRIVKFLKGVAEPQFHPELTQLRKIDTSELNRDELFDDAVRIVLESRRGSVSLLQRRLNIGYARASRIIEMMAGSGILGEYKGSQAREVLMTVEEYEEFREESEQKDSPSGQSEEVEKQPSYISEGQHGYISVDEEM